MAVFLFVAVSESNRRARLDSQLDEIREKTQKGAETGGLAYLPPEESNLVLLPGDVKQVQGLHSGPASIRIFLDAPQRVAFGLVAKGELSQYNTPHDIEYGVERLPCASAGEGHLSFACELPADAKDLTLVVADLRERSQASSEPAEFDEKRRHRDEPTASSYPIRNVSITVATALTPSAAK